MHVIFITQRLFPIMHDYYLLVKLVSMLLLSFDLLETCLVSALPMNIQYYHEATKLSLLHTNGYLVLLSRFSMLELGGGGGRISALYFELFTGTLVSGHNSA